jgi:hypothetical protein
MAGFYGRRDAKATGGAGRVNLSATKLRWKIEHKINSGSIYRHFAGMFKVDCDAPADVGLYLSKPPIGPVRVTDKHARFKDGIHGGSPYGKGKRQ